jgi:hypothetical protein
MSASRWRFLLALLLCAISALLCLTHSLIFHDPKMLFYYLLLDVAFVPVQVLLVSLILEGLLSARENRNLRKKLQMVIGAFYSEAGTRLLVELARFLPDVEGMCGDLRPSGKWTVRDFHAARARIEGRSLRLESRRASLESLRDFLDGKRDFCLRLLENPGLLEHDSFADLLWAVLHVAEELSARPVLADLPAPDYEHLSVDLTRAYGRLLGQWVNHLGHLQEDYPYLFSLAVRTNPFDPNASVVLR